MSTRKQQRLGNNSVSRAVAGFAEAIEDVPLPIGVELRSDEEMTIWCQFTRARAREDWRDMDLILLAKVVRIEADIRKYQETLDRSGVIIKNKRETLVANPLLSVIDTLQRQQLSIIRSMSLNQQASDPRTLNARASSLRSDREFIENNRVESLLAMPVN